jgi:hypothetical protein
MKRRGLEKQRSLRSSQIDLRSSNGTGRDDNSSGRRDDHHLFRPSLPRCSGVAEAPPGAVLMPCATRCACSTRYFCAY